MKEQMREALKKIREHKKFMISAHINLEGDSLCSQLAMLHMVEAMGKKAVIVDQDPVPEHLAFLPKAKLVSNTIDTSIEYDAALILDCPTLKRIGRVQEMIRPGEPIVNIDHHISNENFGSVNWVEPHASSVGEMMFDLYKAANVPIDEEAALYMYVAIATDSGSFNYDNTTPATHRVAAELIEAGIRPGRVSEKVFESRSIADIRLLGKIVSTLKVNDTHEVAFMCITRAMLDETGADMSKTDSIINYARSVNGAKVAILFREDPKKDGAISISFRAKGEVDVNKIAQSFGGGGHKKASGCVVQGGIDDVRKNVVEAVEKHLGNS